MASLPPTASQTSTEESDKPKDEEKAASVPLPTTEPLSLPTTEENKDLTEPKVEEPDEKEKSDQENLEKSTVKEEEEKSDAPNSDEGSEEYDHLADGSEVMNAEGDIQLPEFHQQSVVEAKVLEDALKEGDEPTTSEQAYQDPSAGIFSMNLNDDATAELIPRERLNILLLGETGSGKSTCVNAIANYIRFENIEEALAGELVSKIDTQFTITDDNFQRVTIRVGDASNENFDTSKSATQKPMVYNFQTEKYDVYLLDTPGIGDCAGIEQDKKNMSMILNALSQFDNIHAICLLMKANEARLTVNLSYCLSELLLRLHREAVHNIAFCFTNSRGTFYRPGDSLTTLQAFLDRLKVRGIEVKTDQNNLFCLDNEAYRLVCAAHQDVQFTDKQKSDFAASWEHSAREIERFLDFAALRRPHQVSKTLDLNQARQLVLQMVKPMADIAQLNQDNLVLAHRYMKEVENTKEEKAALQKKLRVPQETFELVELEHPVTVCTAAPCIEARTIPDSNRIQTIYKKVCHDRCYLKDVDREKFPEPALRSCAAMAPNGKCRFCECDWSLHMHIYYTQSKKIQFFTDPNVERLLKDNRTLFQAKKKMLADIQTRINKLEQEQKFIRQCSANFARFLQDSAILPYNDVFEDHIQRVIEEEKRLVALGGDPATLQGLEESLRLYKEERKAIDTAAEAAKNETSLCALTGQDIQARLDELFKLEHAGDDLKKLFEQTNKGEGNNAIAQVVRIEGRPKKPKAPRFHPYSNQMTESSIQEEDQERQKGWFRRVLGL